MKVNKKIVALVLGGTIFLGSIFGSAYYVSLKYEDKIKRIEQKHDKEINNKDKEIKKVLEDKKHVEEDFNNLKEEIKLSKEREEAYRYDYENKNLRNYAIYSVDEMNEWIDQRAPEDSPFRGEGEVFLEASVETDLDPKYIVAHAALESDWGKSNIAQNKNNYFGIGAYNYDPRNCAKDFETNSFDSSIIEGAKWINENYTSKGQDTLNKMLYGKNTYCTLDDNETPDDRWARKIVDIVY